MVKMTKLIKHKKTLKLLALTMLLSTATYSAGEVYIHNKFYGKNEKDIGYGPGNRKERLTAEGWTDTFENQAFKFRLRDYSESSSEDWINGHDNKFEYFFNHGYIGDSKVKNQTVLEYRDFFNTKGYLVSEKFNFAEYYPEYFDWLKIGPYFSHIVYADGDGEAYENNLGIVIEYGKVFETWDYNGRILAARQFFSDSGEPFRPENPDETFNESTYLYAEFYATKTWYQHQFEKTGDIVSFKTEVGLDPLEYNSKAFRWNDNYTRDSEKTVYSVYLYPYIQYEMLITDGLSLLFDIGAEYRNWRRIEYNNVADWTWQASGSIGIKYKW